MNKHLLKVKVAIVALPLLFAGASNAFSEEAVVATEGSEGQDEEVIQEVTVETPDYYEINGTFVVNENLDDNYKSYVSPYLGGFSDVCQIQGDKVVGGPLNGLTFVEEELRYNGSTFSIGEIVCRLGDENGDSLPSFGINIQKEDSNIKVGKFSVFSYMLPGEALAFVDDAVLTLVQTDSFFVALEEANTYLNDISDVYVDLANMMAEEIRGIKTSTVMSQKGVDAAVETIHSGIKRANELIEAFNQLDFSKLDSLIVLAEENQYSSDSLDLYLRKAIYTKQLVFTTQDEINELVSIISTEIENVQGEHVVVIVSEKINALSLRVDTALSIYNKADELGIETDTLGMVIEYAQEAISNNDESQIDEINHYFDLFFNKIKSQFGSFSNVIVVVDGQVTEMIVTEKDNFDNNTLVALDVMYTDSTLESQNIIWFDGENYVAKSVLVNDSLDLTVPVDFLAKEISFDRMPYNSIASFVLPWSVPTDSVNGDVYEFGGLTVSRTGADLLFNKVESKATVANRPYLVLNYKNGMKMINTLNDVEVSSSEVEPIVVGQAMHTGTYTADTLVSDQLITYYAFMGGQFHSVGTLTVPSFRTYITSPTAKALPKALNVRLNGQITGIALVSSDAIGFDNVNVYDLLGRVVRENVSSATCFQGLADGTYVVNGTKYIIKNQEVKGESASSINGSAE